MTTEFVLPQMGETVSEGTIVSWLVEVGQEVSVGQSLVEVATDKVDTEVPSPVDGVVHEIVATDGETIDVGAVLALIGAVGSTSPEAPTATPEPEESSPRPAVRAPASPSDPVSTPKPATEVLSPVVRRLIKKHDLDVDRLTGTGSGGRITRSDVELAIKNGTASAQSDGGKEETGNASSGAARVTPPAISTNSTDLDDLVIPMSHIRRLTGDHMVMSKAMSPHVLTAVEVDFERVERVRTRHRESWKKEHGSSLTYLPFICRAVVDALKAYPNINASVGDGELIVHRKVNLAIAVDLNFEGLVAPVIRDADGKRLSSLATEIADLAIRAKTKQLGPDDLAGGTFTLTNPGQYGTHMQFPLINQPQVAILSTDGIRRKPVAVVDDEGQEAVSIHSVGILALAWDHRAFDGAYVAAFLDKLRQIIESRDWEAEIG